MLNALFNTSWIWDAVLILTITLVVIALIKYPQSRWFVGTVLTVALITSAIYSAIELNAYYSAEGGIAGTITGYFDKNKVDVTDMSFNFKDIMMTENGQENGYSAIFLSDKTIKLSTGSEFKVTLNGIPVDIVESTSNYVVAEYTYAFYNKELVEVFVDTLTLEFAFYDASTEFEISTTGGSTAMKYWNDFFSKNAFVVEIQEVGV